jgi:hypothetical protein
MLKGFGTVGRYGETANEVLISARALVNSALVFWFASGRVAAEGIGTPSRRMTIRADAKPDATSCPGHAEPALTTCSAIV